jgi:hypothetical protein
MGAIRLVQKVLSSSREARDMPAFWEVAPKFRSGNLTSPARIPKPSDVRWLPDAARLAKATLEYARHGRSLGEDEGVGNAISFIIVKLHTEVADPVERLHAIHRSTALAKERFKKLPSRTMREAFGALAMAPYFGAVALNLAGRSAPVFNMIRLSAVIKPRPAAKIPASHVNRGEGRVGLERACSPRIRGW